MEFVPAPTTSDRSVDPTDGPSDDGSDRIARADIDAIDAVLDEVEQSLARIDAGRYGRCEECGDVIDDAALAERPTARRCDTCLPPAAD
ncbi:MAG: TraR/DksA family transcriptional regulator [Acidimicrobiales bacterium]|jgi:RNA polymerase-binding transcription factor DksA